MLWLEKTRKDSVIPTDTEVSHASGTSKYHRLRRLGFARFPLQRGIREQRRRISDEKGKGQEPLGTNGKKYVVKS